MSAAKKPYFTIKNWKEFQHYGDSRSAIWIKFYARTLDDVVGVLELGEITQSHLFKIWLLALRHDNRVPFKPAWIAGQISAQSPIDWEALIVGGWIVVSGVSEDDLASLYLAFRDEAPRLLASTRRVPLAVGASVKREEEEKEEERDPRISSHPAPPLGSPGAARGASRITADDTGQILARARGGA